MPQDVIYGKRIRRSYAKIPVIMELPNLIEVQKRSFEEFLQKDVSLEHRQDIGLQAVFKECFPITDFSDLSSLEFVSYSLGAPKYDVVECQERGMNYAAPLKVKVRLVVREKDKETGSKRVVDVKEQEVYLGELPLMTERGTFIINGAERVIVSQLHRAPGAIFEEETHPSGRKLYSAKIIPYRGAWIEFEYDINDLINVRLDKKKKMPVTTFLRAIGLPFAEEQLKQLANGTLDEKAVEDIFWWPFDEDILKLFARVEKVKIPKISQGSAIVTVKSEDFDQLIGKVLADDIKDKSGKLIFAEGDLISEKSDLEKLRAASVKQVKVKSAKFPQELLGKVIASPIINSSTKTVIAEANGILTEDIMQELINAQITEIDLLNDQDAKKIEFLRNTINRDPIKIRFDKADRESRLKIVKEIRDKAMVEIFRRLQPGDASTSESAKSRLEKLFFDQTRYDLSRIGRYKLNQKLNRSVSELIRTVRREDIVDVLRYLIGIQNGEGQVDDIDHLGNRRVRAVGELLQNQFRIGLTRMSRAVRERMTIQDLEIAMPHDLINQKPLTGAIKDFFGSSQLSQFMQQTNPLDELTHKRRLSALGPGGLHRDRATFEVRDVHHTHYGRICPIETPEGPSVGLIVSLSSYAKVNEYGFLETPYRKVTNGLVTEQVEYLTADKEDQYVIAEANSMSGDGKFTSERVIARFKGDFPAQKPSEIDYVDVSPKQVVSISAALIPFLEHDEANRALMGSNMQRQAVPLLGPKAPLVGTGTEYKAALDSGAVVAAKRDGIVESVSADEIIIRTEDAFNVAGGERSFSEMGYDVYKLLKFRRSNNNTCINQRPIIRLGEKVRAGQVIADGMATEQGELALGQNVLVAFMPWEGYNFEDAILISERLVKDDAFTSIHVEEFEVEARDTKLGKEEITRDIPNVGPEALKNLDDDGIIRIGSIVKPGDILVGKVTPKGESELGPEEKLLRAIFGEKAGDVRDASMPARPGVEGVVVDVKVFSRREKEKDRQSRLREDAQIKVAEKEWSSKVALINQRKNDEIKQIILGQKLAKDLTLLDDTKWRKGKTITADMLKSDLPIDQIVVSDQNAMNQLLAISRLAQGRIESLTEEKDAKIEKIRKGDELKPGVIKLVKVSVATKRTIAVGDKIAGRHGNKGVVAKILPVEDMPYLEDGTPVDVVLNPLGVPGRMNVGQILETHLGWAAEKLGLHIATPVFDGATEDEIRRALKEARLPVTGKAKLYDSRTGEAFDQEVTVGQMYVMKLNHLVDDKIHARSIGPYSLVTQQPLGGKAQQGGQRFGEMEVWALEAYGAAYLLQELLTVKSDDVTGRSKIYETIVKGENAPEPGIPESFNVLVKELQGLCLNVELKETKVDNSLFIDYSEDESEEE